MQIIKRDGNKVDFEKIKIERAISKAFFSVDSSITEKDLKKMSEKIEQTIKQKYPKDHIPTVEEVQDLVELTLIDENYYREVKSFILYRAKHNMDRKVLADFSRYIEDKKVLNIITEVQEEFDNQRYPIESLLFKFESFLKPNMTEEDMLKALTRAASELTSKESPDWEIIAARFLMYQIDLEIEKSEERYELFDFKSKIEFLTEKGLYGAYILENYSSEEIDELEKYMDYSRNNIFTYSGLDLLRKRYLITNHKGDLIERVQEMFMGIAMHLAIPEADKVAFAKRLYDILSNLKATMATPTMTNARKPFNQLSSCFIDTVPDTLKGIYRSVTNFAEVSKHGGGMGLYFGKVRANGSDIRGFEGVAGGVIRWIRLANDTAVAVDQLGVRQGAVAVYLDIWHKDIPEFLGLRTNNGDDRMKAHDVFPGVCVPDLFWKLTRDDINADWHMFDPHEVEKKYGKALEDTYGEEFEDFYHKLVADKDISRRTMSVKDMVRLLIKSWTETGTPFIFNRDTVNKANPNKHKGMIYSSNLCTEIAQNMSPSESISTEIVNKNGDTIIVNKTKPGDFVECNLASLTLGKVDVNDPTDLEETVRTIVRALDNVIDLNYYPTPYAKVTNKKYRAIGLGTSGYHHMLVKNDIRWQDEKAHEEFVDRVYEDINYYAIKESMEIAKEKGSYSCFEGSDWQTGAYFDQRDYKSERWEKLKEEIKDSGLRNGYLMAVAPTGSTSIISGTSAGVDPIMSRYFLEEKKGAIVPRVAPGLTTKTFWLYENAHDIDQNISMRMAGVRQRHIDQAQSVNIYITTEYTMRQILNVYITAWESGVKSIYYVRGKSLEVEECDSCAS
ncbi:ribonucleoside-diphosphate reductase subunit alpha [uncultured Anaerococcus sp.]|uniref:ribonucleoside-diphosphate reductase subunit alpha n=1 Tax=uncultured Anaerococcus sp. TaxID=293428 RepID=UPI00280C2D0F|nr:ribonucleoside-diphosphate reductase subunit alpha [uncultured Anaerococcus sp.]MDU5148943.1 ribonucleoside-diphosphate reductase subunit alpha [Anaerococcus prevotii]